MKTVEGVQLSPKELALMEPNEALLLAARPSYATVISGEHWSLPLMLLTDQRMVLSRERLLGRPKNDFSLKWAVVEGVAGELWNGGGPQIRIAVRTERNEIELIVDPRYAVEVESAIRQSYLQ